jgi:hypothetical protein
MTAHHDSGALRLGQAKQIIGSLGFPSKMPGTSYGLSAHDCLAGRELAKLVGSICSECYALKDKFTWPNVQTAFRRRARGVEHPLWVDAMVAVLRHYHRGVPIKVDLGLRTPKQFARNGGVRWRYNEPGFHRWHDSGDLQSVEHYEKILEVCRRTPSIRHWLPTRELAIVRASKEPVPENLTIRVSATMIDGRPPSGWPVGSTVHTARVPTGAWGCPAHTQGNQCQMCRACWSRDVPLVSYPRH